MNGHFIERNERGNEAYYSNEQARGGLDNIYDPHYHNLHNQDYHSTGQYIDRRPWSEERDRNWNIRGDRGQHRHDEDRNIFERMGHAIKDKWDEWTGSREDEEHRYHPLDRQGEVRVDRSWDEDWDRIRHGKGRIYNANNYRTLGQRGGYIPEREMGNYLYDDMYDYGTGNYGAQGMGITPYDQDFTYVKRGQSAGSANVKGRYHYDRNNEPDFNRDPQYRYHDEAHRHWRDNSSISNRIDDVHALRDKYTSRDADIYRGGNEPIYREDDYTTQGQRQYFANDVYGVGRMGSYHDTFPEDYRYDQWRRGTR